MKASHGFNSFRWRLHDINRHTRLLLNAHNTLTQVGASSLLVAIRADPSNLPRASLMCQLHIL